MHRLKEIESTLPFDPPNGAMKYKFGINAVGTPCNIEIVFLSVNAVITATIHHTVCACNKFYSLIVDHCPLHSVLYASVLCRCECGRTPLNRSNYRIVSAATHRMVRNEQREFSTSPPPPSPHPNPMYNAYLSK